VKAPKLALIGLGVLVGTFGIGYLVATRMLFPPLPEPKNGIVVPDLTGVVITGADARLQPLGLRRGEEIRIAHPDQPEGVIVAQSPLPGQQLRTGGVVTLAVSGGLPRVDVPNVIGFDIERATNVLSQLGLTTDQRSELSERPIGTVLRSVPEPGQPQPVPSRVLLIVSAGPPPKPPADSTARPDSLTLRSNN
jgi:eukaryotic-like serine/threonine-protein kinase